MTHEYLWDIHESHESSLVWLVSLVWLCNVTHIWLMIVTHIRLMSVTHTFLPDGYCSTVQGLLDWFEVDLGFTELSFIQIDLCVLCDSAMSHTYDSWVSHTYDSWVSHTFIGKVVFICLVGTVNLVLKFLGQPGETRFQPGGGEIWSGVPMSFNTKLTEPKGKSRLLFLWTYDSWVSHTYDSWVSHTYDSCDWQDWGLTLEALPPRRGGSAECPKKD